MKSTYYRVSSLHFLVSWLYYSLGLFLVCKPLCQAYEVVYAVNCGGPSHTDVYGIKYSADSNPVGIQSEYGMSLTISRVHPSDMILYQTERYHTSSFSYDIPIQDDGEYVLLTKYSEVYFQHTGGKVFNVVLNLEHVVVSDLDIFARAGGATAHDEVTRFRIEDGLLEVNGESSNFGNILSVEFSKGQHDNPKVNAIVLLKGPMDDSALPSLISMSDPTTSTPSTLDMDMEEDDEPKQKFTRTSGPKTKDPYSSNDSWFMPITIAIAIFLPVLFFLCRVKK